MNAVNPLNTRKESIMSIIRSNPSTLIALAASAVLMACSSIPASNPQLDTARADYRQAQNDAQTRELASAELKQAGEALERADQAYARRDETGSVNHLAYVAAQRTAIAQESARQRAAERAVAQSQVERDRMRLAARTSEADAAKLSAATAQRQTLDAQRQTSMAVADAEAARRAADDAQVRTYQLETELRALNAKQTERGLVITIGDVLFDNNQARLKPGGLRNLEQLAAFMKQYPQRRLMVEGHTDSVGSDSSNEGLSQRRAEAVRDVIVGQGVAADRLSVRGLGETRPVASNDNAAGRQMNRRVEILLSDVNGVIASR
ncbi:OmpA family protein [Paucibacter soli]|uniref:OmpA family protein n=1 Tax=Paucibacter soli TaxID=3133433 RepID=UPI0030B2FECD